MVFGAMSTKRARFLMDVATKPKGWQHSWMQFEPRTRSYFIGRNIAKQSKEEIKTRMQNANIVIFYIHGQYTRSRFQQEVAYTKQRSL
jgi:hypothetical protein